ncbi:MAG: AAA family ATPase [Clostridia bacterium]|nr:AAA family ATPase [Clostridia bacterium]
MNKGKISLDYYSILKDLWRNLWVVLLSLIIGAMGIYIVERSVYEAEYTATATVVVSAKGSSTNTSAMYNVSSEMATVFSKVFSEPAMRKAAAEHLGHEKFDGRVAASVLTDTNFINISVVSDSPRKSYELLNAILQVYPNISEEVFKNSVITILKHPSMPSSPSSVGLQHSSIKILLIVAFISIFAIVALSVFRDTVKNEREFNDKINGKLLGCITHEIKANSIKDLFSKKKKGLLIDGDAFISTKFIESFNRIVAKIEHQKKKDGSKVFAVTSFAENEGKSTVSANLALSLARKGNRVLLMDMDGKKPALYKLFGCSYIENAELGSLFNGDISRRNYKLRRYKKTNLYLAINTRAYANTYRWIESGVAKSTIKALKGMVDYIIVDTAPISVDSSVSEIIKMADKSILVVKTDTVETGTINDAILTIKEVGDNFAGCILNQTHPDMPMTTLTGAGDDTMYFRGKYYGKYYGKYH